jgi:glycosyltransferase involved in cell wall biosynthesis
LALAVVGGGCDGGSVAHGKPTERVAESLACGTPVAAFRRRRHSRNDPTPGETGFLAKPHDAEELGRGIGELLARGGPNARRNLRRVPTRAAYAPDSVARRHLELYRSLLEPQ